MCGPHEEDEKHSHSNESWWASQVICAKAEEIPPQDGEPTDNERFYKFQDETGLERWVRLSRLMPGGPPDLGPHLNKIITAFTEVRQPYWSLQPRSWITYHAFTILEIDNGALYILCERKTDMLELVFGEIHIPMGFMKAFRAVGPGRNPRRCVEEPRQPLSTRITVRQLLGWIDGPVEEAWKAYDLLQSNCQHFAHDLQMFLLDPSRAFQAESLSQVPPEVLRDHEKLLSAVERYPRTLKYLPEPLRNDPDLVLTAVSRDGNAIRYAPERLRADKQIALAAVKRCGYALPYVHPLIRQDRDLVLAAVRQNGYVLCYCAEEHRADREVVMAAVRQEGYALRYVAGKLRYDPTVLMAAGLRDPIAMCRSTCLF